MKNEMTGEEVFTAPEVSEFNRKLLEALQEGTLRERLATLNEKELEELSELIETLERSPNLDPDLKKQVEVVKQALSKQTHDGFIEALNK